MDQKKAKFGIGDLLPVALTVVVTAIGISFGLNVLSDIKTDMTASSYEANATQDGIEAVAKFTDKLGIIVTVVIAALLIGLLTTFLMRN